MVARLFAVLLFACAVVAVKPVAAVDPLTITFMRCESNGGGRFSCYAQVSGGVPGYSYTWSSQQFGATWTTTTGSTAGGCTVGRTYYVNLTVTDSAGATASSGSGFYCSRIAP